jgi:signal transduction histidine kinase/CheY-like chemotaxis protein
LVALHRRANDISVGLTGAPVARMTADPIRSIDRAFDEVTGRLVARNEELKTQTQRAEEASAAKSAFLSNMSHEIRTPLNGVLGMVELLRGTALDRKQRQYCDGILASGQGLQGMLNNLLDMAKIESGSMEIDEFDFDPAALAREVAEVYASLAHHGDVQVIADIAPNLPWVEGDAPKVRQILFNLMNNARKFTRKGHIRLTVQAKAQTGDGRHNIEFCVDDTGPGITPTARALLFVPFAQSTGSRVSDQAGSGLGLSICKALTDKMGGSILVDTKLGRGTRIVVTIPFSPARHVPDEYGKLDDNVPGGVTAAVPSPGHVAPRVLIVEDNEVNREVISAMLERLGVATDVAVDGSQAVGKVGSQQYDLVFMDCRMPIMDGFEATRAIRAMPQGRGLPIVALTANAFTDDREQCIAAGMDDFLSKPTSISKISAMLDRYVLSPLGEREPMGATIIATPAAGEQSTPAMRGVDLDHSALDALRELERSGAKGVVSRIVNAYLEAVPPLINLALAGEREHDPKRIANAVHQLKASSLTVGAVGLATVARDIDRACNAGTYEGEPPVAALEVAWRAVEPLLKQTIEADLHQPAPLS